MGHPISDEVRKFHEAVARGEGPLGGPRPMEADVEVEGHGSLYLFRPLTAAGREHLEAHYPAADEHTYSGDALAVEWRYIGDVAVEMIEDAGLILKRGDMYLILMEDAGDDARGAHR